MDDAPGLKLRQRKDGTVAHYWVAAKISSKAGDYPLKTIRLHGDEGAVAERCRVLTAELKEWLTRREPVFTFSGTVASLIDCYLRDPESPLHEVKANTQRDYVHTLKIISETVGNRAVAILTRKDFTRWHRSFGAPAADGGPERMTRAYACMKLLRIIARYGASMRYDGCRDMADILGDMRFKHPPIRESQLAYDQARAIVAEALRIGRPSLALGQALQFELSLRQKDVIGEWTRSGDGSGIVDRGQRWSGGILWSDLSADGIVTKRTTKTAARGEWNVGLSPLVIEALTAFPADARIGPMIVSEVTGRPYRANDYQKAWRRLADAVGVPRGVWNMDSRAGGITEADEAGADPRDVQRHATHGDMKTTSRYVRRTLGATEKVARLRIRSRDK